jgi:hypothetical protein
LALLVHADPESPDAIPPADSREAWQAAEDAALLREAQTPPT